MHAAYLNNGAMVKTNDFFVFADTMPHIVWIASRSGRVEYLNRRGVTYIGQEASEIGADWVGFLHPDDSAAVTKIWNHTTETGEPETADCRLRRHDGTYRWYRFQALALRDNEGALQSWMGVATDVDDEHVGQQRVRDLEHAGAEMFVLLETLLDNAPVGFGLLDLDLCIVRENEVLAELRGGIVADHIGRRLRDVIPERWSTLGPILSHVITHNQPMLNQEIAVTLPDGFGQIRYLSNNFYPVNLEDELIGVGVVATDITERVEADVAQRELTLAAVSAIAAAVEARDPYTAGHQRRVATIAAAIAAELGCDRDEVEAIELAASIHDIGKLGIPAEILSCPRRLTVPEFELIKTHSQTGYDIVAGISFAAPIASMVLQHHERLDGSGYPNHLKGDQILLGARVIAVADTVEAMASHRPYRPARGVETALAEIANGRGRLYDTAVADACSRLFQEKRLDIGNLTP